MKKIKGLFLLATLTIVMILTNDVKVHAAIIVEQEPNDNRTSAKKIELNENYCGTLNGYSDKDYWSMNVLDGKNYRLTLNVVNPTENVSVEVYGTNGEYLVNEKMVKGKQVYSITANKNGTVYLKFGAYGMGASAGYDFKVDEYGVYYDKDGEVRCTNLDGSNVINEFRSDGIYTYYFQADGTAMKDRLTYHPDGKHVIYFDEKGHEVFSDFHHVSKSISGDAVDDYCFFDVYGYMYVDVLTYDKSGTEIYYANPYGRLEMGKWFQFSQNVKWADGTRADLNKKQYGYANADGTLMVNQITYDWLGRRCYLQGNGAALY